MFAPATTTTTTTATIVGGIPRVFFGLKSSGVGGVAFIRRPTSCSSLVSIRRRVSLTLSLRLLSRIRRRVAIRGRDIMEGLRRGGWSVPLRFLGKGIDVEPSNQFYPVLALSSFQRRFECIEACDLVGDGYENSPFLVLLVPDRFPSFRHRRRGRTRRGHKDVGHCQSD